MLDQSELPTTSTHPSHSLATWAFLGPPPLIPGEKQVIYNELLVRISGTLRPADILEEIWIRDVVDLVWGRRLKANLMGACAKAGLTETLGRILPGSPNELVKEYAARDHEAVRMVERALGHAGLTVEGVGARNLLAWLSDFERIERMIAAAEGRRHAALRELERHRATLARTLRRAVADFEEAEVIAPETPAPEAAA